MADQEFDDGINKLVSLRRNTEDTKRQLDDLNKQLVGARNELESARSEATRLRVESQTVAAQKDQAQKDLDGLKAEKDLVNSKFTEESAKRYKELRVREEEVASREAVIQARLLESERRESLGAAQDRALEDKARGLLQREKDCEAREADVECSRLSLDEVHTQNSKVLDRLSSERKKAADDKAAAVAEQEKARQIADQARLEQAEASRQLVEARAIEARNLDIVGRVGAIQTLRKETEALIIGATKLPADKVAELVEAYLTAPVKPAAPETPSIVDTGAPVPVADPAAEPAELIAAEEDVTPEPVEEVPAEEPVSGALPTPKPSKKNRK